MYCSKNKAELVNILDFFVQHVKMSFSAHGIKKTLDKKAYSANHVSQYKAHIYAEVAEINQGSKVLKNNL